MTIGGHGVAPGGDESILELEVTVAQPWEGTKGL